ncbi:hypothetical protein [Parasitella parasitica]|uniref:AD domain-containing protein n=1 Tax=Parasitella parasitica TaxID=35722 RepID=A0A0B7MQM6_9FUNG|nr:hypothetical protein [Parasitella parasitica]
MDDTPRQKPQNSKQHTSPPTFGKKSLDSIVGRAIKIKTASNEEIEGLVYTYDRISNCIAIDSSPQTSPTTTTAAAAAAAGCNMSFRIIKISHIKEIISLGDLSSSDNKKDYLPVNRVQVDRLKSRESEALKGFQSQVSKIGVGVTKEGQDIFNALSKTLPCRWSKETIVVMDEILITPPYGVDDCKASASSAASLTRVKKVHIVTATDDVLDLLGYTLPEIMGQSIQQCLDLKLTTKMSCIPQCKIRHANGNMLDFQVCIHQDPLGSSSCLDYWLIRLSDDTDERLHPRYANAMSVIRLSPFGTIEQIQASPLLKQPINELVGRPVMAFVYSDDVEPLCSSLSKLCSAYRRDPRPLDPLFIRWSNLPHLLSTSALDQEDSLNYDWMSLTLMPNDTNNSRRPICILQPLQIPTTCQASLVASRDSVFDQLLDYYKCLVQLAQDGSIYVAEFYYYAVCNIMDMLSIFMHRHLALQSRNAPIDTISTAAAHNNTSYTFVWNFIKSSCFLQKSLTLLEFTGIFDQQHYFKTCVETDIIGSRIQ